MSSTIQVMILLTVISLAPALLLMTTSFVRIVVVVVELFAAVGVANVAIAVVAHRVVQERGVVAGPPAPIAYTPFVGREQELALLLERWDRVVEGEGQVVLLDGEAGIGKSRLLHELRERLGDTEHTWLECGCSPFHTNTALYGVTRLLEYWIGANRDDSDDERFEQLFE